MGNTLRTLIFDIETAPITAWVWGLYDQNIGLNQIKEDWHLLAWAAKWLGEPASKVMYMDNRRNPIVTDDKMLAIALGSLISKADVIVTQNGDAFDVKKLNARLAFYNLPPVKPAKSIDILKEERKVFAFTSHKLAYVTEKINTQYKKTDHKEYPGFELWKAVLDGDLKAWKAMEKYTKYDVLSTEEAYQKLAPYFKTHPKLHGDSKCRVCGSPELVKVKDRITANGVKAQFQCKNCGHYTTV